MLLKEMFWTGSEVMNVTVSRSLLFVVITQLKAYTVMLPYLLIQYVLFQFFADYRGPKKEIGKLKE
jgi:hypothetical protein